MPSVADVLAMPVVRAARPEVVGGGALDRPVRWVHVIDLPAVAELLVGGELVLTTGQALAHGDAATVDYLNALAAADVSGLVVELGSFVPELPPIVAKTADALGLPVIALHRVTRFVEITEAVHRMIVADQYAELEFARTVHETFTELSVRRASLSEIVKTAAGMLDAPVVLEDLAHRVLALTVKHTTASAVLDNWETTSRLLPDTADDVVAVGPHTQPWGRLILRSHRVPTPRARMVLERAAQTLTLHRMIDRDRFGLHRRAQTGLIDDMVNGRVLDEREAQARAAALGLARRAAYVPLAIHVAALAESDPVAAQRRSAGILDAVTHGLGLAKATALIAAEHGDRVSMILAVARGPEPDAQLRGVCNAITGEARRVDGVHRVVIGVGAESDSLLDTARELAHAAHVAEVALSMAANRPFYRSGDVRLRGLLSLIRNEPGVQRFAETELSALLRYDIRHSADLTRTLRQFLDLAGNKTELARRLNISRPTLYDRLARIERILDVDLEDGESRTSLHAALLIRDLIATTPTVADRL